MATNNPGRSTSAKTDSPDARVTQFHDELVEGLGDVTPGEGDPDSYWEPGATDLEEFVRGFARNVKDSHWSRGDSADEAAAK